MYKLFELLQTLRCQDRWMPRERWDSLVRGENCAICADMGSVEKLVVPRYYGDAASGRLMHPDAGRRWFQQAEYDSIIAALRAELH